MRIAADSVIRSISDTRDDSLKTAMNQKASNSSVADSAQKIRTDLTYTVDSFYVVRNGSGLAQFNSNAALVALQNPYVIKITGVKTTGALVSITSANNSDANPSNNSASVPFVISAISFYVQLPFSYSGLWVYVANLKTTASRKITISNAPVYSSDTSAYDGGLRKGDVYQNSSGQLYIKQ